MRPKRRERPCRGSEAAPWRAWAALGVQGCPVLGLRHGHQSHRLCPRRPGTRRLQSDRNHQDRSPREAIARAQPRYGWDWDVSSSGPDGRRIKAWPCDPQKDYRCANHRPEIGGPCRPRLPSPSRGQAPENRTTPGPRLHQCGGSPYQSNNPTGTNYAPRRYPIERGLD